MMEHILEIVAMLLVSAILGFFIAWFWRKDKINELEVYITSLEDKNNRLQTEFIDNEKTLMDCQAEKKKLEADSQSVEKLLVECQGKLVIADVELAKRVIDIKAVKIKKKVTKKPVKKKIKKEKKTEKSLSKQDIAIERVKEKASKIDFVRIGTSTEDEKDDLKIIKGVGPFIEKKLNALGIFRFKQIANFTDEDKDLVNEAIEFFKGRIKRDDWVGQAKDFIK